MKWYASLKKKLQKITSNYYEIDKMIVFSTTHISETDNAGLAKGDNFDGITPFVRSYGYAVYADPKEVDSGDDYSEFSTGFHELLKIARKNGCRWLMLDCDGPVFEELKKYEW